MFGMGIFEMLIVLLVGGVFLAVIVTVVNSASGSTRSLDFNRMAQPEEENWRLRNLLAKHGISVDGDVTPKK